MKSFDNSKLHTTHITRISDLPKFARSYDATAVHRWQEDMNRPRTLTLAAPGEDWPALATMARDFFRL